MTVLPAFRLPPGMVSSAEEELREEGSAGWPRLLLARFDEERAAELLDGLARSAGSLRGRRVDELIAVLGRVGGRFLDPEDVLRREAEARLPLEAAVSPPMAREIVEGMARDWTADRLERTVRADFPDPEVLDGLRPGPEGMLVRALGDRLAFHVGSGNVPGVCATSLIRSLLVKCPVLLKPGRGDLALSCLFARGLAEEDEEVARSAAVVYWPRAEGGALEAATLEQAERVVAYGGSEAVSELRRRLPATTPLVAYHHRVSMGAVGRDRLDSPDAGQAVARSAARAVAVFDQRGCVSPLLVWVEEGGMVSPRGWAKALAKELEAVSTALPPGPVEPAVAARIQQLRGSAELRKAAGSEDEVFAAADGSWTVLFEPDPRPSAPCQGRTVHVKPVASLDRLPGLLEPYRSVVQSFALEASDRNRAELAERLAEMGVTRVTGFGRQPWPPPWWRHDGQGPLLAIVRWIGVEPG